MYPRWSLLLMRPGRMRAGSSFSGWLVVSTTMRPGESITPSITFNRPARLSLSASGSAKPPPTPTPPISAPSPIPSPEGPSLPSFLGSLLPPMPISCPRSLPIRAASFASFVGPAEWSSSSLSSLSAAGASATAAASAAGASGVGVGAGAGGRVGEGIGGCETSRMTLVWSFSLEAASHSVLLSLELSVGGSTEGVSSSSLPWLPSIPVSRMSVTSAPAPRDGEGGWRGGERDGEGDDDDEGTLLLSEI
mmetsp:Transcript_33324/g.96254  ORF Transcript_33324/g.96254 Transcript_33324/m.96254 type:complete len:249 (-) Transcript_33324:1546-2292(-)